MKGKSSHAVFAVAFMAMSSRARAVDTTTLLTNVNDFATALTPLLGPIAFLAGIWILGRTLVGLTYAGRSQSVVTTGSGDVKTGALLLRVLFSSMLMSFGFFMGSTIDSLFGGKTDYRAALSYAPVSQAQNSAYWTLVWGAIIAWVVLLGTVGMFRGLLLWNEAASGDGQSNGGDQFWQGFWHIAGGAASVNIGMFFV